MPEPNWREIQAALVRMFPASAVDLMTECPICGQKVLQGLAGLHIEEEHPQVAARIRMAMGEKA